MEQILREILTEIRQLRAELQTIKSLDGSARQVVAAMLRRRGVCTVKRPPRQHLVLPPACSLDTENEFYGLMQKYSFRIFLRDLITYTTTPKPGLLTRYCSAETAQHYLAVLLQHHILRQVTPACYEFTVGDAPRFGDTLEWFVAQVLEREFAAPAAWGNLLKNTAAGGDYDVIAALENRLAYLEVKSAPPKHIDMSEIRAFVDRVQELRPDFAIFLEDTQLRMQDKLVGMFAAEMQRRYGTSASQDYAVRRVQHEIFSINNIIFIANTKPDLIGNLAICFKHFFAKGL